MIGLEMRAVGRIPAEWIVGWRSVGDLLVELSVGDVDPFDP